MTKANKKRRVLFLFAHLHKGGMQRAVSNISLALPDTFEQYVGFFGTENPGFEYNAIFHDFNVPGSLELSTFVKIKNFFLRLYTLNRFVREHEIDVVISFGETANFLNVLSLNQAYSVLGIRVADNRNRKFDYYEWIYHQLIKWIYTHSNTIIAVSEILKNQTIEMVGEAVPVYHIPNLYHLSKIRERSIEPLSANLDYLSQSRFILNVGSLANQKGQEFLIHAFAQISGRRNIW